MVVNVVERVVSLLIGRGYGVHVVVVALVVDHELQVEWQETYNTRG